VAGVGVTGLAGLRAVTGAPALSGAKGRDIVLEAREVNWELAPGKRIRAMAYTLHGQSFRVLSVNGARLAVPVVKDTVDVHAHMGSAEMEFTAHNPGDWLFHCHNDGWRDDGGPERPNAAGRPPAGKV